MNTSTLNAVTPCAPTPRRDLWTGRAAPGIALPHAGSAARRPRTARAKTVVLHPGARVRGVIASDAVLRVETGRLWITVAGDVRDHFVGAGRSIDLPRRASVLIEVDSADAVRCVWTFLPPGASSAARAAPADRPTPGGALVSAVRIGWRAWRARHAARQAERQLLALDDARLDDIGAPAPLRAAARGYRRAAALQREVDRMMLWR